MSTQAYRAMIFAREVHKDQVRKYSNDPYIIHLAEVAGIVGSLGGPTARMDEMMAIAWLHDCREDQGISHDTLMERFGGNITLGVNWLSDLQTGNRAARNAAAIARLHLAPAHIQTIKCADLISNSTSILKHDPKFAVTYIKEKAALLDALDRADSRLWGIAKGIIDEAT